MFPFKVKHASFESFPPPIKFDDSFGSAQFIAILEILELSDISGARI